jgi:hypothetical protein
LTKPLCNAGQVTESIEFVGFTANVVKRLKSQFGEFSTEKRVKAV